jgi:hypothetical protein
MALDIKPWNPHTSNEEILDALHYEASSDYQRRVPDSTKASVQQQLQNLMNYTPHWNEFVSALVNKIGLTLARNNNWTNPLARYKRGLLEFGDTIEEVQTGLIQAYTFDPRREYGEKALFGKHIPEVQSSYHTISRENIYPLTVQKSTLQRAFLSPDGLAQFVTQLMESASTSDNWDEFMLMCQLFPEYDKNGGFFRVHVDDIADSSSTEAEAKSTLRTLRQFAETIPFLSRQYNAARMPVHANPEDMILITTPEFKSGLDVNALAALFNVSYGEVPFRTHVIPKENLGIADVEAILTTKDFFVVADTYFNTDSQPNPAGRYENFFLHHDQIISASRFVPAIAFTTGEGTIVIPEETPVTGVEDIVITNRLGAPATNVTRGESYDVTSSATTEGNNDAVQLKLSGNLSTRTYLANNGSMHVAIDEDATALKITAIATDDNSQTKERTVNVVGDKAEFWPNPGIEEDSDNDGLLEVTPKAPTFADPVITVPNSDKVEYKEGVTVVNGTQVTVASGATKTITATAKTGYEIKTGATASWPFTAA